MRNLNYWEHLAKLNLYSLERRRDRYFIIYTWKILMNIVPNISSDFTAVTSTQHIRRGRLCVVPPLNNRSMAYVRTLKERSFLVHGPKLFNSIPQELRNFEGSLEKFKNLLDFFIKTVPDKPALPNYIQSASSNCLIDQINQLRAERNT